MNSGYYIRMGYIKNSEMELLKLLTTYNFDKRFLNDTAKIKLLETNIETYYMFPNILVNAASEVKQFLDNYLNDLNIFSLNYQSKQLSWQSLEKDGYYQEMSQQIIDNYSNKINIVTIAQQFISKKYYN